MLLDILYTILKTLDFCVLIFMAFPIRLAVGPLSLYGGLFTVLNVWPFDCTAVAGSGKVGSVNRLTTPVVWL